MVKKVDKEVAAATSSKSKKKAVSQKKADLSKPVEIKVNKLTEQGLDQVFDKIIERNTKNKPAVKVKYRPPKKPKTASAVTAPTQNVILDKKAIARKKKALEIKREANKIAAQLKLEAEEKAAWIKSDAEEKAAWIKQEAEQKAAKLNFKSNRKAVKRELKEAIKQAKLEAAEKLGKTAKKKPTSKFAAKSIKPASMNNGGSRIKKGFRNVLVASFASSILILGAGVIYTWYMGLDGNSTPATSSAGAVEQQAEYKPIQRAANAKQGAAIQYISSPILIGTDASISVRTNPDSQCKITVEYNKVAINDPSLVAKAADEYGMVNWDWKVGQSAPVGKWPVTVTCALNGKSAVVVGDLQVVKAAE